MTRFELLRKIQNLRARADELENSIPLEGDDDEVLVPIVIEVLDAEPEQSQD
jgi:hypothetical protein